ncbi:MAG: hypothetical protein SCARUB_00537 [Candidatus Scalindua rubra]|uniref:Competence protein A n=1 Tax=Candidatus Scalindua rubra TaxID=1872076 RepID=A0A1E3XFA2_9BACT|nr:MAG: hypothetical protein SCARUB_00537 [Candidatus Scalindua rubra]
MTTTKKRFASKEKIAEKKIMQGKGVDIGTAFVKCAARKGDSIIFRNQRNAFFEVEFTDFTKKMLDNSVVRYIQKEGKLYVVGDEALKFANIFHKEARRPLSRGIISPTESEALPMIELLIKSIVDKPSIEGEIAYYSVPGEPLDADFNVIYHEKILHGFLTKLGYTPKAINESHAIILSELADEDFTGIGLSFGGGMVNVCLSYISVPIFKFSVTKSGDWIDQQVAMAVNETASRISAIKESSLDLNKGDGLTKFESALSIYYNHLIEYVIENIKDVFEKTEKKPRIDKPISIILAGGTSLPKGFADRFKRILYQLKFPLKIGSIRMASQPVRSVAKGALVAARADEEKR